MKQFIWAAVFALWSAAAVLAQPEISIGEQVEFSCTRVSSGWCSGKVEAMNGGTVKVKWGNMRDQFTMVSRDKIRVPPRPDSPETTAFKEAFAAELGTHERNALRIFAHYYYPDEFSYAGGTPTTPAGWQELMGRMAAIDALCKGKYRGMTNRSPSNAWPGPRKGDLDARFGEWCKIADQRLALEQRVRADAAIKMAILPGADDLKKSLEYQDNRAGDDVQMLMYEPEKWKAEHSAKLKPHFANYGVEMPSNFLDEMLTKAAELKTKIDQGSPGRSFEMSAPSARDAAVESFIKAKWVAEYPGSQVLKTSHSYPTWAKRESLSLVGSGTGYKLYKVEYNFYKRGWVLMKMPNRPYCQAREWIVGRGAKGLVAVSTSSQGTFVKCQ